MSKAAEPAAIGDTSGEANLLPLRSPDQNNGLSFRDRCVTLRMKAHRRPESAAERMRSTLSSERSAIAAVQALDAAGARIGNVHKFLLYQCTRPFG